MPQPDLASVASLTRLLRSPKGIENPSYTNADLRDDEAPEDEIIDLPTGVDPTTGMFHGPDQDPRQLINDAKRTLIGSDYLDKYADGVSTLDSRAQALGTATERAPKNFQRLTEGLHAGGTGFMMGAPFTGPAAPLAFTAGSMMAAPDILRRLIAPAEGESKTGAAIEGALTAAPAVFAAGKAAVGAGRAGYEGYKARSAYTGAREAFETGATKAGRASTMLGPSKLGLGHEVMEGGVQQAVDPNQVLEVARQISEETGVPVEQVMKGYFKSGGVEPGRKDALMNLFRSGQKEAPVPQTPFQRMSREGAFAGDRSTGSFAEGDGGLSSIGSMKPHAMPNETGLVDSMPGTEGLHEFSTGAPLGAEDVMRMFQNGENTIPSISVLRKILGGQ